MTELNKAVEALTKGCQKLVAKGRAGGKISYDGQTWLVLKLAWAMACKEDLPRIGENHIRLAIEMVSGGLEQFIKGNINVGAAGDTYFPWVFAKALHDLSISTWHAKLAEGDCRGPAECGRCGREIACRQIPEEGFTGYCSDACETGEE